MSTLRNPFSKIIRVLVTSELKLAQIVLAISSMLHGMWILFPEWVFHFSEESLSGAPRSVESVIAGVLIFSGLFMLLALVRRKTRWERLSSLYQFMVWIFLTGLALMASSITGILWVGYATITLLAGAIYLSVSARLWVNGYDE